ncbi:RNA polymerase sigma factor [Chitinophaga defluvii]|uniref:RNA polymerase sigma-70 factor n=1 Tax=Chitinophaga defluvii TaxID=3163343 RepID=A0ABV2T8P4_9BACT
MATTDIILPGFSIDALKNGDPAAFSILFNKFYPHLCFFAQSLVEDKQVAEEIAEDVFVKLWQRHSKFEKLQNVKAFLYIATKNSCFDHLDSQAYKKKQLQEYKYEVSEREDESSTAIIREEVLRKIAVAMDQLPDPYRQVMTMTYEGLKNKEIAKQLNITESAVSTQKARGLNLLRKQLSNKEYLLALLILDTWL